MSSAYEMAVATEKLYAENRRKVALQFKAAVNSGACDHCDNSTDMTECEYCAGKHRPECRVDCAYYKIPDVCVECVLTKDFPKGRRLPEDVTAIDMIRSIKSILFKMDTGKLSAWEAVQEIKHKLT